MISRHMSATAFASGEPLDRGELRGAPIRYPRPGRLQAGLNVQGAKAERAAAVLGLQTVGDLLEHLPHDSRQARSLAELTPGEPATIVVEVLAIGSRPVRRRGMRALVEARVGDASGQTKATFFNQPWLVERYPSGTRLVLHGKSERSGRFSVQTHARTSEALGGGDGMGAAAVAHYPASDGLSSTQILALVRASAGAFDDVLEPLPTRVRCIERLAPRGAALRAAHFPVAEDDPELARVRLAFDELLLGQLTLLARRRARAAVAGAPAITGPGGGLTARWLQGGLPFELTADQRAALAEIDADLASSTPMQRLLMGEVGSGKTVVALHAMLRAVEHDLQAALMAPTETLAEQHFATIQRLLGSEPVRAALLTGSTPASRRGDLLAKLATGELSLIVGTHALIEETVVFASLGVVVVDEQHRFGVRQRTALDRKGAGAGRPHVLHMTATPIPRTLALCSYGDLDFTMLRELPRGRPGVSTVICGSEREREGAYERIRTELRRGRQAFVVCPLVVESEALEARAATAEFERLSEGPLRGFRLELLHGQMRSADKQAAMSAFAEGRADVLVATSVIEVGIDVPNATVMLVEDAERYGISQLHQLRGRVGRGPDDSVCLLLGRRDSARLRALATHSDGFDLADIDLRLRGEGELGGSRQHGAAQHKFAILPDDAELLERARRHAERIAACDPELEQPEHALIAQALRLRYGADASAPLDA
jgi:ATP-dependent DNA helicase RecG